MEARTMQRRTFLTTVVASPLLALRKGFLPQPENGLAVLPLTAEGDNWRGEINGVIVLYSKACGLEKEDFNGKH